MTLTCTLKNGSKKVVLVPIDPPLAGYDDVKPRLLEMKAISQEGLGMVLNSRLSGLWLTAVFQLKSPEIKTFHLPPSGIGAAVVLNTLIPYAAFSPSDDSSPFFIPAQFLHSYVSPKTWKIALALMVGIHMLEGLYTLSLCRKHRASFRVTVRSFSGPIREFSSFEGDVLYRHRVDWIPCLERFAQAYSNGAY